MSLAGKTAVVTGSTSGIGLAVARALAADGAKLMINGLVSRQEGDALASELAQEFGVQTRFSPADMSDPDQIQAMVEEAIRELGGVDVLVNNAGIQHTAATEDFPRAKWDAIIGINLSSAFHAIQAALPHMQKQGWGRIINTGSVHALVASVNKAAYVAAKHGIVGLTKVVALENADRGITCNAICPGWVLTPLIEQQIKDLGARENLSIDEAKVELVRHKQPSKTFVQPEQIGALASFLASDAASAMTGTALPVDGGWTAQ
ncbi:3-hydroxybutyrate dehydrogenase [Alkalilimnicola sp. S0819]|uniref:3-hydroxybutyrate dehydrogenase n=1 Tax=Alkalilimnicola sp. S0819 TaxID=2613922 RepID=UPI001262961B|nr:3-hydroxybutyrate dehydrogenase [Alkalilimnicola sp. S0819]KAB7627447.1 3-hydroxybutyrate dehydrogenase [Alkalilimnicola sp. S0819]MPQ15596.1 3-hydroxybutyrate dehydrogenase [Alkalilimnicola sp. S0819]